jgi:hypothetical protein
MNPRLTKYEFTYDLYIKGLHLRTESLIVSIAEELSKQKKYENSRFTQKCTEYQWFQILVSLTIEYFLLLLNITDVVILWKSKAILFIKIQLGLAIAQAIGLRVSHHGASSWIQGDFVWDPWSAKFTASGVFSEFLLILYVYVGMCYNSEQAAHYHILGLEVGGFTSDQPRDSLNSVVLVRKRTLPTERPQPLGEVSAKSAQRIPTAVISVF